MKIKNRRFVLHFLPNIATNVFLGFVNLYSMHIISPQGTKIISGFGIGHGLFLVYMCLTAGLITGTIDFLAKHDSDEESKKIQVVISGALIFALAIFFLSFMVDFLYISFLDIQEDMVVKIQNYLHIMKFSLIPNAVALTLSSYLTYRDNYSKAIKITIVTICINLFGLHAAKYMPHFFKYGCEYIAIVSVISSYCSFFIYLCFFNKLFFKKNMSIHTVFNKDTFGFILSSGYIGTNIALLAISSMIFLALTTKIGYEALSVISIIFMINRIFVISCRGYGVYVGTIVLKQRSIIEQNNDHRIVRAELARLFLFFAPICSFMVFFPDVILQYFLHDMSISEHSLLALRIAGISLMLEPLVGFLSTVLKVNGFNKLNYYFTLYLYVITIPLAGYLSDWHDYGLILICCNILFYRFIVACCNLVIWQKYSLKRVLYSSYQI